MTTRHSDASFWRERFAKLFEIFWSVKGFSINFPQHIFHANRWFVIIQLILWNALIYQESTWFCFKTQQLIPLSCLVLSYLHNRLRSMYDPMSVTQTITGSLINERKWTNNKVVESSIIPKKKFSKILLNRWSLGKAFELEPFDDFLWSSYWWCNLKINKSKYLPWRDCAKQKKG